MQPILAETPTSNTERDARRKRFSADSFSLILFGLLNPVLKTMRGLVEAGSLPRIKREVCSRRVSLGSFSEMQHGVDPELLTGLLRSLAEEAGPSFGDAKDIGDAGGRGAGARDNFAGNASEIEAGCGSGVLADAHVINGFFRGLNCGYAVRKRWVWSG